MGISVKMVMGDWLGPGPVHGATAPVSLGMASTFQLDDIPQASNGSGGKPPHGTIKFAATNQQAMLINKCFTPACRATLTITNLTAQGMAVYELRLVRITQVQIGQYVDASFTYGSISWQMYATGSGTPSQTGSWSYTQ
jgi:hypothetical protein